jgi:hypothetical protein
MSANLSAIDKLQNDFPTEKKRKHFMNFLYRQLLTWKHIHMDFTEGERL